MDVGNSVPMESKASQNSFADKAGEIPSTRKEKTIAGDDVSPFISLLNCASGF
jgi:hypothetical protein